MNPRDVFRPFAGNWRLAVLAVAVFGWGLLGRAATPYYFDANGNSSGLGTASGSYTWDTSANYWNTHSNPTGSQHPGHWSNSSSNEAYFNAGSGSYTMNITDGITAGEVYVRNGEVNFSINSGATWSVGYITNYHSSDIADLTFADSSSTLKINSSSNDSTINGSLDASNGGIIDFGSGVGSTTIDFTGNSITIGGTLTVYNWGSGDHLEFSGSGFSSSDPSFLSDIQFYDGSNYYSANWNWHSSSGGYGYVEMGDLITAIPEPATVAMLLGLGALGFAAYRRRRGKAEAACDDATAA